MANECSFSDLILLIGTNPLPNFVVADYFLQQKHSALERVWLLHAKENERIRQAATIEQAQRVEKLLRDRQRERAPERTISFEKVGIPDVGDPENIRSEVTDKVLEHIRNRDFHLDYSGGTKAMSTKPTRPARRLRITAARRVFPTSMPEAFGLSTIPAGFSKEICGNVCASILNNCSSFTDSVNHGESSREFLRIQMLWKKLNNV